MVVAKMLAADVPMEVLSLKVQGERIGQQMIEGCRDFAHSFLRKICGGNESRRGLERADFTHQRVNA
jgi:hypothetical protein